MEESTSPTRAVSLMYCEHDEMLRELGISLPHESFLASTDKEVLLSGRTLKTEKKATDQHYCEYLDP